MKHKMSIRLFAVLACVVILAVCIVGLVACRHRESVYYLSLKSNNWDTYRKETDVPIELKFQKNSETTYSLSCMLSEGDEFVVNKLGSKDRIGYDSIFSTLNWLTEGSSNNIEINMTGIYTLTLDVSAEPVITYRFVSTTVTSVSITSFVKTLYSGEKSIFEAKVTYADNSINNDVVWSSSNNAVATIDSSGLVNAISQGTTTITATSSIDNTKSDSVTVSVGVIEVPVTGISLDKHELLLEIEDFTTLTATVFPENATSKNLLWESDNTDIVSVTQSGVVTANAAGTTVIRVTTATGGFSDECVVTVRRSVKSIKLNIEHLSVVAGGSAKTVSVLFNPSNATFKTYKYEVTSGASFINIVPNVDGTLSISGVAEGTAKVLFIADDNKQATAFLDITVLAKGSVLADMQSDIQLTINGTATVSPSLEGAQIESVTWSVDSDAVVDLSATGVSATVTGKQFGSTTITANILADNGNTYSVTRKVLVTEDYFFIYGVGIGTKDWDWEPYLTDRDAAEKLGILFDEQEYGIYTLTMRLMPINGFQIIFPNVASYVDESTGEWNKNIPSVSVAASNYYDATRSDNSYVSNSSDQFKVNTAGTYRITLDLTGTSAKVYIKLLAFDVTSVSLEVISDSRILKQGSTVVLSVNYAPSSAIVAQKDINAWISSTFSAYASYVSMEFDFESMTISVKLTSEPTTEFLLIVHCEINDVSTILEIPVLPNGVQEVPVTEIAFEQEHYYFNVNNGGAAWEQYVKASVNSNATNQQVRYIDITDYNQFNSILPVGLRPTVNADTGLISGRVLGSVVIKAVAMGDESVTATCIVTFYSDELYLIGDYSGSWESLGVGVTTVSGTKFANYKFTMLSKTHFTFELTVNSALTVDGGFQIAFCGMDSLWNSVINSSNRLNDYGTAKFGWSADYCNSNDGKSTNVLVAGTYVIDVDLSRHKAVWTFNYKDSELSSIYLAYAPSETLLNGGGNIHIELLYFPAYLNVSASDIVWTVDKNEYVSLQFDFESKICTVNVVKVEFSTDVTVTLSCSVKGISQEITLTLNAEHHLVWKGNNQYHWQACTDDGCNYTSSREAHSRDEEWDFDEVSHYHACDVCGLGKIDEEQHFWLDLDGWYSANFAECPECGFVLYELSVNSNGTTATLTGYHGRFEKLRLPSEINGLRITAIGANVFQNNEYLKQIEIPSTVSSIGDYAFDGCYELVSVELPNSVTSIGNYLFRNCISLTTVKLNNSLTVLGDYMFANCSSLVTLELPICLEIIGKSAFRDCELLSNVQIPTSVLSIGDNAFFGCLSLNNITLPATLKEIGSQAFYGCESLKEIVVPNSVTTLGSAAFAGCLSLVNVDIGSGVTGLPSTLFNNCVKLEVVMFRSPSVVTSGTTAFANCNSLKAVYFSMTELYVKVVLADMQGNNDRAYTDIYGVKHAYFYSNIRPSDDVVLGPFAGVWHYDENGKPQLWSDTPVTPDEPTSSGDMNVHIDFMACGNTWNSYKDNPLHSGDGVINSDGSMSVTINWTFTHNYGGWPNIKFKISVDGPAIEYGENYTYSDVTINAGDTLWKRNNNVHLWYDSKDITGKTFAFTFNFDAKGLLLSVDIIEVV